MLNVRSIKHSALRLFARGEQSRIKLEWQPRLNRILYMLDAATHPEDLSVLGDRFRKLSEDRSGTYAAQITEGVYVTYQWSANGHPVTVDLENLE